MEQHKKTGLIIKFKHLLRKTGAFIGPGFLTGAAGDDPSGIGTYSIAGAKYGLLIAWLVPFQLPLMFAIQETCARIGLITKKGLAANMKQFFPKTVIYPALAIFILANIFNIGANIAIMSESATLLFGLNFQVCSLAITTIIILLQVFVPYHLYAKLLAWLSLFLVSYVITGCMTTTHWLDVIKKTFTPTFHFSTDFILIATGLIGTTISPYLFFWQTSQELEELNDVNKKQPPIKTTLKRIRTETFIGMFFSQLIAWFIIITSFSTLHSFNITEINSAAEAALALRPLAGDWAFILFALGIIGAGLIGIPVLAGSTAYALSEVFNYKASLSYTVKDARFFYSIISLATLGGLLINFVNINPMQALLYAAVINGIATVPFIIFILILANKTEVMGIHKNSQLSNAAGTITLCLMMTSALLSVIFPPFKK